MSKTSKIIYSLIAAFTVLVLILVGNNFYQTRKAKINSQNTSASVTGASVPTTASVSPAALPEKSAQPVLAVINISGFDCPSCPTIAENALKDAKGVLDAKTTSTGEGSRVLYDANKTTIEEIAKTLPAQYGLKVVSQKPSQTGKLD